MKRIAQTMSRAAFFGALPMLFAVEALAGVPQALDRVPSESKAVVVVPNLGELIDDVVAMNALLGEHRDPMVMAMAAMVRAMPGLDLSGSVAGVLEMTEDQRRRDLLMVVPVEDYDALAQGREAVNGVTELPMMGQTVYMRDIGDGYVVMGEVAELVRAYDGGKGNLSAHAEALGEIGSQVADKNDIFVYVNIPQYREEIDEGLAELEAQSEMVAMMGGVEAAQGYDRMVEAMESIADDARVFTLGLSFDDDAGVSFDVGLQFEDGSESSAYLHNDGDAGRYLGRVPSMDYFYAVSYDLRGQGVRDLIRGYLDLVEQMDSEGMMDMMNLDDLMEEFRGGVQVMGASDNIMGGLFTNTFYYAEVENPSAFIETMRSLYEGIGDQSAQLAQAGVKIEASVSEEPTSINGVDAYSYSMSMDMSQVQDPAQLGGPNPAMMMQMMFGGTGPSGYLAPVGENGLVVTMSQSLGLLTRAVEGAQGKDTLADVAAIKQTRELLPKNRVMEMYIAADHLANTAGPMAMMFGLIPEFEPIESLPPIGMGLSADDGGVLFRAVFPKETISKSIEVMEQMQQSAPSDGDDMEF